MTPEQLLDLIRQGENSGVEFQRDDLRREQLAREVVAFANFQGGRIVIGVEDDGTVSGVQREDIYVRVGSTSQLATRSNGRRCLRRADCGMLNCCPSPGVRWPISTARA